jgi:hypothetical protein
MDKVRAKAKRRGSLKTYKVTSRKQTRRCQEERTRTPQNERSSLLDSTLCLRDQTLVLRDHGTY